jgi:hypothetical protein
MTEQNYIDSKWLVERVGGMLDCAVKDRSLDSRREDIARKVSQMQTAISTSLPDALDLMDEIQEMVFPTSVESMSKEQVEAMERRFPRNLAKNAKYISGRYGNWNSFAKFIPKDEDDILVSDGTCVFSVLWCWDGMHADKLDDDDIASVTHWMPYPKPPSCK